MSSPNPSAAAADVPRIFHSSQLFAYSSCVCSQRTVVENLHSVVEKEHSWGTFFHQSGSFPEMILAPNTAESLITTTSSIVHFQDPLQNYE